PKMFSGESYNTEISASYENGSVDSNNPRILAPLDAITPWFGALNKGTYAGPQGFEYTTQDNDPATVEDQWLGAAGGRLFGGMAIAMGSGASPVAFMGEGRAWPDRNGGKDA